jgi:hypothetical protein
MRRLQDEDTMTTKHTGAHQVLTEKSNPMMERFKAFGSPAARPLVPDKPSLRTAIESLELDAMHARKQGDHETSQQLEDVAEYLKDLAGER